MEKQDIRILWHGSNPSEKNERRIDMTNEEKARAIIGESCKKENCLYCGGRYSAEKGGCIIYQKIMQMAEWKDRQFKQNLDNAFHSADHVNVQYMNGYNKAVEKAWQYIKENYGGDYASETLVSECKKFFVEYMQEGEK